MELIGILTVGKKYLIKKPNEIENLWINSTIDIIDQSKSMSFASIWCAKDRKQGISRVFRHLDTKKKDISIEFILWGFNDKIRIEWSLILPSEFCWIFDKDEYGKSPTIHPERKFKDFQLKFNDSSKKGVNNIFEGKNNFWFIPHDKLQSNGLIAGKFIVHKDVQSIKYSYITEISCSGEKTHIHGPIVKTFEIKKGASRSGFIIKKDNWIAALCGLVCVKNKFDWGHDIPERFERGRNQSYTPLLLQCENTSEEDLAFFLKEYRILHLFVDPSVKKDIQGKISSRITTSILPLSKKYNKSKQLFDCVTKCIKDLKKRPNYPQRIKFDLCVIFPENAQLALLAVPFMRYLNALPLIYSKDLQRQLKHHDKMLTTRLIINIGVRQSDIKREIEDIGFALLEEFLTNTPEKTIETMQYFLLKCQILDYLIEEIWILYKNFPEEIEKITDNFPREPFKTILKELINFIQKGVTNL